MHPSVNQSNNQSVMFTVAAATARTTKSYVTVTQLGNSCMFLNLFLFYQVVRPLGRKSANK